MERRCFFPLPMVLVVGAWNALGVSSPAQEEPRSVLDSAYAKTKTAESIEDFTGIIALCNQARAKELSPQLSEYSKQLLSWTHNRRGEVYAEQAAKLLESGQKGQAGELDAKALADFEKAVEFDSSRWKPIHNRGVSYALVGKYEKALADFSRVVELKPDYSNAWFNLGEIRRELGELDKAVDDYSRAIRLKPDDFGALMGRGQAFFRLRRLREALEDFQRSLVLNPHSADAYANRGDTYQGLGMWEQAAEDLRHANQLDKMSSRAYQAAAWLMATCPEARFRQADLAVQAAEHAIQLAGTRDQRCLDTLAAAYANAGRFDEAVTTLNKAMDSTKNERDRVALQGRMRLYKSGKPYRQEQPAASQSGSSPRQ